MFTVKTAATAAGQATYVRMSDWDILDQSNQSLIGAYRRDTNVQQIDYSNNYGNNAFQMMAWSASPREAFSTGAVSGYVIMTGNEKLSFTCPSGLASASYVIDITGYIHANFVVEKGVLRIERD